MSDTEWDNVGVGGACFPTWPVANSGPQQCGAGGVLCLGHWCVS